MSGHTKGPWCVMQYGYEKYSVNGEYGVEICGAWRRQDAQLIAAAPDLLEALEWVIDAYSKPDKRICCSGFECGCMGATEQQQAEYFAKEAIAKARGAK